MAATCKYGASGRHFIRLDYFFAAAFAGPAAGAADGVKVQGGAISAVGVISVVAASDYFWLGARVEVGEVTLDCMVSLPRGQRGVVILTVGLPRVDLRLRGGFVQADLRGADERIEAGV